MIVRDNKMDEVNLMLKFFVTKRFIFVHTEKLSFRKSELIGEKGWKDFRRENLHNVNPDFVSHDCPLKQIQKKLNIKSIIRL